MSDDAKRVGWIGTGRMGFQLAARLLSAGVEVWAWNRTRSKAEPLAEKGAKIVDSPRDLAECDIVFTMVGGPADVLEVTFGDSGVLSREDVRPPRSRGTSCARISSSAWRPGEN